MEQELAGMHLQSPRQLLFAQREEQGPGYLKGLETWLSRLIGVLTCNVGVSDRCLIFYFVSAIHTIIYYTYIVLRHNIE